LTSFVRRLQDNAMTRRQAKKQPKRPAKKKITGTVIESTAQQITLKTAKGLFIIQRTAITKVISGTLKRGSTVTVEFTKLLAGSQPGKRTETGTVLGLSDQQIKLQVFSISLNHDGAGGPGTFLVDRKATTIVTPKNPPPIGSVATVEANDDPNGDWHQVG
jgi:hypothetical protein